MLCHDNLKPTGTFKNGSTTHKKFVCQTCFAKWQWSPVAGYYQNRKHTGRKVHSFRATDQQIERAEAEYGSVQGAWDYVVGDE